VVLFIYIFSLANKKNKSKNDLHFTLRLDKIKMMHQTF
jgi:hypothetical protein